MNVTRFTVLGLSLLAMTTWGCSSSTDSNTAAGGAAGTATTGSTAGSGGTASGNTGSSGGATNNGGTSGSTAGSGGTSNGGATAQGGSSSTAADGGANPAACPANAPGRRNNGCDQQDLQCSYQNQTCTCSPGGGGGFNQPDAGTNLTWRCQFTPTMPAACPATAPQGGATCDPNAIQGACTYAATTCFCAGGRNNPNPAWACFGGDGGFTFGN